VIADIVSRPDVAFLTCCVVVSVTFVVASVEAILVVSSVAVVTVFVSEA